MQQELKTVFNGTFQELQIRQRTENAFTERKLFVLQPLQTRVCRGLDWDPEEIYVDMPGIIIGDYEESKYIFLHLTRHRYDKSESNVCMRYKM